MSCIDKSFHRLRAGVLAAALIVGILILMSVLALLNLMEMGTDIFYSDRKWKQQLANIDSACELYCRDSLFMDKLDGERGMDIFDNISSRVEISRKQWGLYEVVSISAGPRVKQSRILGYACAGEGKPALYLADNNRSIAFSGKTNIRGKVQVSSAGITYRQMMSEHFVGDRLDRNEISVSKTVLPEYDRTILAGVEELLKGGAASEPDEDKKISVVFSEPTRFIMVTTLADASYRGNIILKSNSKLTLDGSTILEDVILIAPDVKVANGFKGSVQIIATDSVTVERGAEMRYPSGIFMYGVKPASYVEIGSGSTVSGYVVFVSAEHDNRMRSANYIQRPRSRVRGLIYIDGVAQLNGTITGSAYVRNSNYYSRHGQSTDVVYNVTVIGNDVMAFPMWIKNDYRRQIIKSAE